MINNKFNYLVFFLIISISLTIFFVGKNNFFFNNVEWLYGSGDLTNAQLSWKYFLNDVWRFPLGKNPNYGLEVSNSIIFTDNIPLFAIFFKILKPFISPDFQYFGLWILLCFFLQLLFSFLLLNSITKDNFFSLIAILFFLLVPFLLFRISHHFSLGAHWLILYAFYNLYFIKSEKKNVHWYVLIFLSLLIHLYFTAIIFIIYFCSLIKKILKNKNFQIVFNDLFLKLLFCFILMYIVGYFESSPINAVSTGYGIFKIDLLSFFDPKLDGQTVSWSIFLPDLPGTHLEGFTYIGISNIILILLALLIFLQKKFIARNYKNDFPFISFFNISLIIFFLWAISTNISFLGYEVINIDLPKYIFGALSIFSSTGRFAWPVIYIVLFFSLLVIYKNTRRKFSISLISLLLLIQIVDISKGLKTYSFKNLIKVENNNKDEIWNIIAKDFDKLRTTYLYNNYGPIFSNLSKILGRLDSIKTDIILNAAMDREKAALVRYKLINDISKNKLDQNTAYIIDNKGHLNQLKLQFSSSNHGFFLRDNFWIILPNKRYMMNQKDINELKKIKLDTLELEKIYNLNFKGKYQGFGWSHNSHNDGIWSEGKNSFLIFNLPKDINNDVTLKLSFLTYQKNFNENYKLNVLINGKIIKSSNLNNENEINLLLSKNHVKKEVIIQLNFEGLISPFEVFESPDARKLGILLKTIQLKEKI